MKSQRTTQQTSSRTRKPNTRYPSIYNLEDLTMLETSLGSTYRSKGTPSGPENLCENAPSSRRQDLKINEFATKSYNINAKELPPFPENLLETRESLDIGIERNEDNGDDIFTVIRSMTLMNKMNIKDRNSQKENVFDLHTKLNTSQNKKELGVLKPLRELKLADKAQKELSMSACSHRMNGEPKIGINAEGSNIKQLKGDYQEPKGLDLEEEIEGKVHAKNKDDIHKSRILSPSNTFRPDTNSVLKNIENYRYNTSNYDPTLNKPNPTMSLKRTKFQENVKDFVLKKRDENAGSSKPLTMHIKYGDKLGARKSVVLKGGSTNIKSTMPVNKLEGISRSTKRVDSSLHSSRLGTRREDQRSNKIKRTDKNCADYFKNPVVMKNVLSFLCVNSLTKITRVSKNFRVSENLSFIKKLQSKLIARGLGKREQYEFWDLRLGFDSLQHAHPAQFAKNALKKSAFERDVLSDIDRTRLFNSQVAHRKECLLRILFAISNSMPKLGYVQGLNSIVAVFISQDLKDYEVYWLMKYILKKKKFDGILSDGFPMVQLLNYQLEIYVRHYLPEIISHLEERDLNISYFTTQWFITMFSYDLELSQLIKIWNLFLLKGWKTVIKVSLALLWHFKEDIMKKSADDLPFYLKNFLRERSFYISEDTLFKIADTFKVNNRILKTLEILHERSAPTNVILFITPGQKPECKIASTHPPNKNSSVVYKDIMEYLNEDIDHMRIMNKTKGNVSNELDNYRSIQNANFCSNLIVDKQSGQSLNRNTKSSLNILDDATNIERLNSSQTQGSSMAQENGFLQTLSGLGKRLKQILTPKNDPPFLPRKFSDAKIINPEQEDFREPLSERPDHRPSIMLDRANSKFDSVTNSLDFSSSSRSRDIGYQATDRQFEFTLGARNYTEMPSGRNAVLKSRQVDSPQSTAKSVLYPVTGEYKHKRNSSMPYDQFGILTTFRNSTTSYFEQTSPDNLSLTENDNYLSARLALEEIKGMRKSNNQGFYLSTETSVRKNIPLQKAYSLEERVRSSMNGLTSQIMNAPKRPQIERKY